MGDRRVFWRIVAIAAMSGLNAGFWANNANAGAAVFCGLIVVCLSVVYAGDVDRG